MKSPILAVAEEEEEREKGQPEFAFAVTEIAVAQICRLVGFTASQRTALETMTDVAVRYLGAVADSAAASANYSGRTQSNLYDVVRALEDLGSVQGFRGASKVNRTLLASSTLSDLAKFVKYTIEIPFARPIPRLSPPAKSVALPPNSATTTYFPHIPRWLPPISDVGASDMDENQAHEEAIGFGIGTASCGKVDGSCLAGEKMRMVLPEKRPRVKFKVGLRVGVVGVGGDEIGVVDLRNGVCKGGKRVSFQNNRSDVEGGDHSKNNSNCTSSSSKRRR